jgi:hypothetical protein
MFFLLKKPTYGYSRTQNIKMTSNLQVPCSSKVHQPGDRLVYQRITKQISTDSAHAPCNILHIILFNRVLQIIISVSSTEQKPPSGLWTLHDNI